MPGFNGTGPMGQGPMTGRGFGYCNGGVGRGGVGYGRGRGFGFGRGFAQTRGFWYGGIESESSLATELDLLKRQKSFLEEQERYLNERLKHLKEKESEE